MSLQFFRRLFRKVPLEARIEPEGHTAIVVPGQSLLDAVLAAGISWPWRCRVGSCGRCRCRVIRGEVRATSDFAYVLKPDEIATGTVLACQTRLDTSITVTLDKRAPTLPGD